MTVNPDAVLVLARTDLATVVAAINAGDMSLIRLSNGAEPTDAELQLIMQAGPADYGAASRMVALAVQAGHDAAVATEEVLALLRKYNGGDPKLTVTDVWGQMTPEDRKAFHECQRVIRLSDEIGGAR